MKVVILAGGMGTRLSEETEFKPKPMVEIGEKPLLWHIMRIYSHYGFRDFVICLGYKGYIIKEYFANYSLHEDNVTIDMKNDKINIHHKKVEPWKVTLVDTGINTMTGGRIKKIEKYVGNKSFMLTYGDGVADINIKKLVDFHRKNGRFATVTAVQPVGRFGTIDLNEKGNITAFHEKPPKDRAWINGGFFVLEPNVFRYIDGDSTVWEKKPLESITRDRQLTVYKHLGFWKCMDTMRDKIELEKLWQETNAPWKVWK